MNLITWANINSKTSYTEIFLAYILFMFKVKNAGSVVSNYKQKKTIESNDLNESERRERKEIREDKRLASVQAPYF